MTEFVVGAGVVNVNVKTDALGRGFNDARQKAESAGDAIANSLAKGELGAIKTARAANEMGRKIDDAADRAGRSIEQGLNSRLERASSMFDVLGAAAGGFVSAISFQQITQFGGAMIKAASDAEEMQNKVDVAFKSAAGTVRDWADQAAINMGRSRYDLLGYASDLGVVANALGVTADDAKKMSTDLAALAVDLGSLFNTEDADAMRALVSGITGEAEALKRFGVVLNEATLEAELLAQGIKGGAKEATEAEKAVARYNVIMQQTAIAHGDAERTIDSTANTVKQAQAQFEELTIQLGQELAPIMRDLLRDAVIPLLQNLNQMDPTVRNLGLAVAAAVAVIGPAIVSVTSLLALLRAVPPAAATAAAASAGAARTGALAGSAAGGIVGVGATVAVVGGLDVRRQNEIRRDPTQATTAELEAERARLSSLPTGRQAARPRGQYANTGTGRRINAINEELERRAQATIEANAPAMEARRAAASAATAEAESVAQIARGAAGGGASSARGSTRGRRGPDPAVAARQAAEEAERERERLAREEEQRASARDRLMGGLGALAGERLGENIRHPDILRATADTARAMRENARTLSEQREIEEEILKLRHAFMFEAERGMQAEIDAARAETERADLTDKERAAAEALLAQAQERLNLVKDQMDQTRAAENQAFNSDWEQRIAAQEREIAETMLSERQKALTIELSQATTRQDRARIEKEILELERQIADSAAEAAYQGMLRAGYTAEQARAIRDATLANNRAGQQAGNEQVDRNAEGPMAQYIRRMRESTIDGFENAQVNAIDGFINDIDAIATGAKSAEDALRDMVRGFLVELIKLQAQKAFLALMGLGRGQGGGSVMTPGGGFGGGGFVANVSSFVASIFGGKRARGGPVNPGQAYVVGENSAEMFMPKVPGAIWNPQQLNQLATGNGGTTINIYADNVKTDQALRGMIGEAMQHTGVATHAATINTIQSRRAVALFTSQTAALRAFRP